MNTEIEDLNLNLSCVFVIFGGTGDLTKRKLIPAIYSLKHEGKLPKNFALVSIGRRDIKNEDYINELYSFVKEFSRYNVDEEAWRLLSERIFYKQFDFVKNNDGYIDLNNFLKNLDEKFNTAGNRLFYLAVAPEYFDVIIGKLNHTRMIEQNSCWQRVIIEKPFGSNLKTARELNKKISKALSEEKIFRIDHYLGKEMVQNIIALRFANSIFEPLWNNNYIDNIQIISTETIGVENRGGYYETSGILKDMLQNHLLQLLTLVAMEPPVNLHAESIRDEKVKVLKSLRPVDEVSEKTDIVRGQYGSGMIDEKEIAAYREEEKVSKVSNTETFIALKLYIDNFRWGGVPFYIKSGKRLNKKETKIVIEFKKLPGTKHFKEFGELTSNVLVVKIHPTEGVFFQMNIKKPGNNFILLPGEMDYCQTCKYENNSPEAYEVLLLEAIKGNNALFTRWDELENSWRYVEGIERASKNHLLSFPNYKAGSRGPKEADDLIKREGRAWFDS